jgi:hypothetical protein
MGAWDVFKKGLAYSFAPGIVSIPAAGKEAVSAVKGAQNEAARNMPTWQVERTPEMDALAGRQGPLHQVQGR